MMNICLKKYTSVFMVFALMSTVYAYGGGESDSKREASGTVFGAVRKHGNIATMACAGVGALVFNQLVIAPFLVSFAAGFASEAFFLESEFIKNEVGGRISRKLNRFVPSQFTQGLGDGATFYLLHTLGGTIWSRFSGIPVTAGLIAGQAVGIAINNRDLYNCLKYGCNRLIGNNEGDTPPHEIAQAAAIERTSGAALSWFFFAGLASKLPKIF